MEALLRYYKIFEKTVSNVKFAVVIITLFTLALVFGTFMESYHGADYAGRLVYKSWWFILIELGIFVSVFMATVVRLPAKKRLYGFYTIHAGILILFIGSFFTYINGIDGSIQLLPNTPAHKVLINEDVLKIEFTKLEKAYSYKLPATHGKASIDKKIHNVDILTYLPFAEDKTEWIKEDGHNPDHHSATYMLFNDNVSQEVTLSLSPNADFKSITRMGLLNFHYMPALLKDCFARDTESGFIVWNIQSGECFAAEDRKLEISKTTKGTRFMLLKYQGEYLKFFPDFSPVPVNDDLTKKMDSPYRVLSKKIFEDKPNLFLFGKQISYYKKKKKKWLMKDLSKEMATLPWMGFKMRLIKFDNLTYPILRPQVVKPTQENGELIKGSLKAVEVKYFGKSYWVKNTAPIELTNGTDKVRFSLGPKEIEIPYQITLDRFQMNKNPGTNNPASFESYVQLLDSRGNGTVENHHIYMNNPLKYDDFTFYQSSYFPMGNDQFGSVLSVNYDPGRFFKYLGSFLIVFGSIWHYILNRRKKPKSEAKA